MVNRCRVPITVSRYKEIKGRIVSREEGEQRRQIEEDYDVVGDQFVRKENAQSNKATGPLIVASRDPADDPEEFCKDWLATNSGFVQGLTHVIGESGTESTMLSPIQAFLIDCQQQFLWTDKCRQFGFSFILAARAVAKSMLSKKHTSIFVSFNEEESKEKIVYARELYDSLPSKYKTARKLKYDNKTSLVFEKSGPNTTETRILSYPQRIIRGKGGGVDVGLDEFAHCIHARKIYTSALPVLSRGSSSLWVGSTPAGKGGLFYEIGINQEDNYPLYARIHIHWWDAPEFCTNVAVAQAEAPFMVTDQRVEKFATQRLMAIRKSMVIDDFQQEYECVYLDESYSYFPWSLINGCVPITNVDAKNAPEFDAPADDLKSNDVVRPGVGIDFIQGPVEAFDEFMDYVHKGIFRGPFLMGFDVGRTTDASEIVLLEELENGHQIARCNITMKRTRLPEQRSFVTHIVNTLGTKLLRAGIDANGIGLNIAEDIEDISYELVSRLPFNNNAWKERACRSMKFRMSIQKITLPTYKPFLNQIHSIKRILLEGSNNWRFDAEKDAKHHGDKFWGLVAASEVGKPVLTSDAELEFDHRDIGGKKSIVRKMAIDAPVLSHVAKFSPYASMPSMSGVANIGIIPAPILPTNLLLPTTSVVPLDEMVEIRG